MVDRARAPQSGFFTICAANYLAHATVLGQSVSAHHAGARLTVFLLDALPAEATGLDHLDIVPADTLMPVGGMASLPVLL